MTTSSPHASSWPPFEEDDGGEVLGAASRVVHQVSRAPRPVAPSDHGADGPSVVISPHAELPTLGGPRQKRVVEPTLVIRDRQQVEDIRAGIRRADRRRTRRRVRRALFWGAASALAFGFGTAVAFFAASSGLDDAGGTHGTTAAVPKPVVEAAPAANVAAAADQRDTAHGDDGHPTDEGATVGRIGGEPIGEGELATGDEENAASGRAPRGAAQVVSLADLPDAAPEASSKGNEGANGRRSNARAPAVVSLEDL